MPKQVTLADLKPDPANARKHNPRNVGMIEKALGEVGAARSIVIDEDGVILAGNATVEAAANAGMERVQVVDADGETIVAVRRTGLTPEQKTKLALYDNRTAELAEWDAEVLADIGNVVDIGDLFTPVELGMIGDLSAVTFPEIDESIADSVEYLTCPKCGHKWPK
jgi:ParB-like chromosome segregation protein Spo0J